MHPHYPQVSARARHACEYCRAPEVMFNMAFEIEHVTPQARGGATTSGNLALACRSCNLYKSAHVTAIDERTGREMPLFNPRRNKWRTHFRVVEESGEIEGLTPRGRATVSRLRINSKKQVEARREWLRLGLMSPN
jgi:hypothetical protein